MMRSITIRHGRRSWSEKPQRGTAGSKGTGLYRLSRRDALPSQSICIPQERAGIAHAEGGVAFVADLGRFRNGFRPQS